MHYGVIVRILAWLGLTLVAGCGAGAIVALIAGETAPLVAFATTALVTAVMCSSVLLLAPNNDRDARPRDGLAALILFWLLIPPFAALVFLLSVPGATFPLALEEATSCLTTTGHTVLPLASDQWPMSLVFWRGLLHVYGALVSLTAVASIFAAINLGGPGIHRTVLFTIPDGSFFGAMPRVILASAAALGATIGVLSLSLSATGMPISTAISDAVSVATTGLVTPGRAGLGPTNDVHGVILFLGLLFSTIGLAVALEIRAGRWRFAARDPELVTLAILFMAIVGVTVLLGERVVDGAAWAISELSTSGMPINASGTQLRMPLPVALLPVIIGGSALSTAGGIKLARIFILSARALQEFRTLAFRKSVGVFTFRGRVQPEKAIIAVWVYLVAYTMVAALLLLLFSMAGQGFEAAVSSAIGTLSNAGHLVVTGAERSPAISTIAVFAMILGRLEVLAALPALFPGFWRS
ncbi:MAG: hypothetical protein AAGJ32_03025 [Pseudomonadota bacterium]